MFAVVACLSELRHTFCLRFIFVITWCFNMLTEDCVKIICGFNLDVAYAICITDASLMYY